MAADFRSSNLKESNKAVLVEQNHIRAGTANVTFLLHGHSDSETFSLLEIER